MPRRRLPRIVTSALLAPWLCLAPARAAEPERLPSPAPEAASRPAAAPRDEGAAPLGEPRAPAPAAGKSAKAEKAGEKPKKKREAGESRLSFWINPLTVVLAGLAVVAVIGAGIGEAADNDGDASPSRP